MTTIEISQADRKVFKTESIWSYMIFKANPIYSNDKPPLEQFWIRHDKLSQDYGPFKYRAIADAFITQARRECGMKFN